MNKQIKSKPTIFLLFLLFVLTTGMIGKKTTNTSIYAQNLTQSLSVKKSTQKIKFKKKRKKIKELLKEQIVDEGAFLLAVLAVGIAGIAVYFFFTIGFFTGVVALIIAALLLYMLFRYLE